MGNYETKINKAFTKSDKPSRYATLRKLALDKGLAVDKLMCCGHSKSSYFFYDIHNDAARKGEYKVSNSSEIVNMDSPRGTKALIRTYYSEVGRAEGFDAAFAFVAAYESKEKANTKTVKVNISGISPFEIKEIKSLPRGFGLSGLPGFESYEGKDN